MADSAISISVVGGSATALKSATTDVAVSSATAPTAGQVLTATSSTSATWQTASGEVSTGQAVAMASGQAMP